MEPSFWEARWRKNQIGFHLDEINPMLIAYLDSLNLRHGDTVLVPMCGKSLDMLYLRNQGFRVIGVELSELAARSFFAENNLAFTESQLGDFLRFESEGIIILCGNIFHLRSDHIADAVASYDRAALVALPPEMRRKYVDHLSHILPASFKTLLITFKYPQHEMSGPPFSVEEAEVRQLFSRWESIELLHTADILSENLHFRERGLTDLRENAFLLQRNLSQP
ncbi:MAG: thiopurine S-methyltransferase [Armatimonadetes bacterium]|nr:thiopurine S-methyltransferase [Armatimonadota bacterium]